MLKLVTLRPSVKMYYKLVMLQSFSYAIFISPKRKKHVSTKTPADYEKRKKNCTSQAGPAKCLYATINVHIKCFLAVVSPVLLAEHGKCCRCHLFNPFIFEILLNGLRINGYFILPVRYTDYTTFCVYGKFYVKIYNESHKTMFWRLIMSHHCNST